jgi:hypothetical protein
MSIDKTKCCNIHTEEREKSGECCQLEGQQKAEQDTYEYNLKIGPEPKEPK